MIRKSEIGPAERSAAIRGREEEEKKNIYIKRLKKIESEMENGVLACRGI